MKICPKCQQQYPNGFQYCPIDTEVLVTGDEYVRRTRQTPMPPRPPAGRSDPPTVELVPIDKPPAKAPAKPSVPPPPSTQDQGMRERTGQPPLRRPDQDPRLRQTQESMRRPEIVRSGQEKPPTQPPAGVPPRPPSSGQPRDVARVPRQNPPIQPGQGASQASSFASPGLSFSLPESGGLLSRLRAALNDIRYVFVKGGPARKGAKGEMQFLLPEEGLLSRIGREIVGALNEFRRNPRRFMVEFVRGEGSNRTRRNALLAGSEMAAVGYVTVYFFSLSFQTMGRSLNSSWAVRGFYIGFAIYLATCYLARGFILYKLVNSIRNKLAAPKMTLEFLHWGPVMAIFILAAILNNYGFYCYVFPENCPAPAPFEEKLTLIAPVVDTKPEVKVEEDVKAKKQSMGGSKPKPKPAAGGGGGGKKEPTPPSKGVPPQMSLAPQISPPSPEPPKIKNPTLVVASTVYGDPKALPPMKGPIGDPSGIPAPPSSGPGSGAGIGRGAGGGVGSGDGGGVGPGRGGNIGGGDMAIGGGRSIEPMTNSLKPTILYKEKAKYTEEARQNKIQGIVILNVVFTADGRITSIKVVRGLPDGLTEKAIEAAQKIRFQPAVKSGQPVSVRGNLEFSFNLY